MSRKWLLGLKAKLLFMGIAPLLVVLFVSYLNRNTINDLVDRLSMALEVRSRLIEHVGEMDASTHALGRWMWITSGLEGDREAQSRFIKKASEEIDHFESERLSFLKLVTDQREKDLVMEVTKEWAEARPAAEAAIRTFQSSVSGSNEAAKNILQKRLIPHLVPMTSTFSELKRIRHQILLQESNDAKTFSVRAVWVTTLLLFFSALGLGLITLRIVTSLPKKLSEIAAQIAGGSNAVGTTVFELSAAAQNMMASTTQQSSAVERTVTAAQEISTIVQRSAELAKNIDSASKDSRSQAENGNEIVEKMIKSMKFISENNEDIAIKMTESNEKISSILTVIQNVGAKTKIINEIVFQTKLLSFNASVEAARAGDAGKGFAVVADEVGTLAQMSGVAATEINQLLDESLSKVSGIVEETKARVEAIVTTSGVAVKEGTEVAGNCGKVLKDLLKSSTQVAEMASDIARSNQESSNGVDEILAALRQLDQHASANASLADSCKRSSEILLNQMKQFRDASSHLSTVVEGQAPMNRFEWKDSYLLGVAAMDEEHLVLIEKINFLAACFENDLKSAGSAIADLASYATKHFADEEQYMESIRYPDVRAHKQVHQKLLTQVSELGAQVQEGAANPDELMTFLNDWLVQHILGTDMKYARYSKG